MTEPSFYAQLVALENEGTAFVLVTLIEALGSTPQDSGAKMLVTSNGRFTGTVGGGKVEAQAIELAQAVLRGERGDPLRPELVTWTLKTDVGMTCGGSVKFYFEPHPAPNSLWPIVVFGAGHVSQALVRVLQPLPCAITVVDARPEWLEQIPSATNVRKMRHEHPAELVPSLDQGSFLLCMTKGHTTDRPILERALKDHTFPFIGVIGSEAKAAVLRRELVAAGLTPERAAAFHCPVGLDFGTNHPHEIALSIAAQLLSERDRARTADDVRLVPTPPAPSYKAG